MPKGKGYGNPLMKGGKRSDMVGTAGMMRKKKNGGKYVKGARGVKSNPGRNKKY